MMRERYESPKNFEFQFNSFILNQLIPSLRAMESQEHIKPKRSLDIAR